MGSTGLPEDYLPLLAPGVLLSLLLENALSDRISLRSWFAAQAQRRIKEQLGEREAVSRAARRASVLCRWGVLQDTSEKVSINPPHSINRGQEARHG